MTFIVARQSLEFVGQFLRERGAEGYEAAALFAGSDPLDGQDAWLNVTILPHQVAYRGYDGVSVWIPTEEVQELYAILSRRNVFLRAKFHTHPRRAYHSEPDDRNMLMRFHGGVSIVIPDFAQREDALTNTRGWSFNVFDSRDGKWNRPDSGAGILEIRDAPSNLELVHIDRAREE